MNRREAKIVALGIAHRAVDAASPAEMLAETGVAYRQDDLAKIGEELAAISRRLEERYDGLLRTGRSFVSPFEKPLPETIDEVCPECDGQVVVRHGRYGRFRACSEYPGCRWKAPLIVGRCPACDGDLVERVGKRGVFLGCSNYPECKYTREPAKGANDG
jgi:DNA topoisomerase-1